MTCTECGGPVGDDVTFRWHVDDEGVVRLEPVHTVHTVHTERIGDAA